MDPRYQTPEMADIWSPRARNSYERGIWIEVMKHQRELGVPIPDGAVEDYIAAAEHISGLSAELELFEIDQIERETRHDLYARMVYFNQVAGHEWAHFGLTSADVVENAIQAQIHGSAEILGLHSQHVLVRLLELAQGEAMRPVVGRTHGRPAQITTLGKRVADWAVELGQANASLGHARGTYMPRGIKGAVGTRADMAALLARHSDLEGVYGIEAARALDEVFTDGEGLVSTGQCYPRSQDLPIVAAALQIVSACSTIATNVRLWAVLGHANEVRAEDQVGSSAMPHKANPRYSERICGLATIARGYASMLGQVSGAMWFDGDVATSAVRRVALPGLFHAVDSALANTAWVLDRLQFDREALAQDVRRYRIALATGRILEACVAGGLERSRAHELLRKHTERTEAGAVLAGMLADDPEVPLTFAQVDELVSLAIDVTPAAAIVHQVVRQLQPEALEASEQWPGDLL